MFNAIKPTTIVLVFSFTAMLLASDAASQEKNLTPSDIPTIEDAGNHEIQRPELRAVPLLLEGVPNFFRVNDGIYRSAQPTAEGMENLEKYGFKTIVSLRTLHSDRHLLGNLKLDYQRIAMQAWNPETEEFAEVLDILLDKERHPVLIHCQHGADRTGAACAIYRMVTQDWTKENAIREMKEGGFGYHEIWDFAVDRFFEKLNVEKLKKQFAVSTSDEKPPFRCERAEDWNAFFDRTDGWLAGDGIFSLGMEGDSRQGSAADRSKTIFLFSDSFFGCANPDGSFQPGLVMVNHCFAVLEGDKPDPSKMTFLTGIDANRRPTNLFDRHFWLGDGIVIDGSLYTTGTVVDPKTWTMEGPWLIRVPIRDEQPVFSETETQRVGLFHKNGDYEVLFGIGIYDQGDDIYVYGFRDRKGVVFYPRQLVVAKAPRKTFAEISTWRFWTGDRWSEDVAECNRDGAALAEGMSNELSVTKMIGGRYDGKFVLVYTEGCISPNLNFAVSDAPNAKFSAPTTFYRCPEPKEYEEEVKAAYGPDANLVTYNAKAHPRFSKPGELLVSYNLNIFGLKEGMFFTTKKHAFPRFVRLALP